MMHFARPMGARRLRFAGRHDEAYAILRHNGVDIGKMDFRGPINWIVA